MLPTKTVANLRFRYIAGLSIIAFLITTSFVMMQKVISDQSNYSSIISLAGHQAGLVNRIAYFSSLMAISNDESEFNMARAQVGRTLNKLKDAHQVLRHGSKDLNMPKITNEYLETIYEDPMVGLEIILPRFLERVDSVQKSSMTELSINSYDYIFLTTYGPHALEPLLDAAVDEYKKIARNAIKRIEKLELYVWLATILTLFFEILFIFLPFDRRIKQTLNSLELSITNLRSTRQRLLAAQEMAAIGDWQLEIETGKLTWSDQIYCICGVSPDDFTVCRQSSSRLIHPDDRNAVKAALLEAIKYNELISTEYRVVHPDGVERFVFQKTVPVANSAGKVHLLQGTIQDITERKVQENKIQHLALYDPLTGLANRRLLKDRLQHAFITAHRQHNFGAVLMLDMDNFKILNDTQGHNLGDALLIEVGKRLETCIRKTDTIARLGGDEFVVLLEWIGKKETDSRSVSMAIAEKIRLRLSEPYVLGGKKHVHHASASIGVAMFKEKELSENELLKRADVAMFEAKEFGRNRVCFFNKERQVLISTKTAMADDLRRALTDGELSLHYQPQVSCTGKVCGAEALLRWLPPGKNPISPGVFIPLAEESGLIISIGEWVLESACKHIMSLSANSLPDSFAIAVNISARQFSDDNFLAKVKATIKRYKIDTKRLKLELTESCLVQDIGRAQRILEALRAMGLHIELDDFGTGYSSLTSLKNLPLNTLKVDMSLVHGIGVDTRDEALLRASIAMAQALKLNVIAEGVETTSQNDFLLTEGCKVFQGYLHGRPVPFDNFVEILTRQAEGEVKKSTITKPVKSSGPKNTITLFPKAV